MMATLTQLRAEHVVVHADALRTVLLAGGLAWSGWLGARILRRGTAPASRRGASALYAAAGADRRCVVARVLALVAPRWSRLPG
jgi:hypothetical protein